MKIQFFSHLETFVLLFIGLLDYTIIYRQTTLLREKASSQGTGCLKFRSPPDSQPFITKHPPDRRPAQVFLQFSIKSASLNITLIQKFYKEQKIELILNLKKNTQD